MYKMQKAKEENVSVGVDIIEGRGHLCCHGNAGGAEAAGEKEQGGASQGNGGTRGGTHTYSIMSV